MKVIDATQALFQAYLDAIGGEPENDTEREVSRISAAVDAATLAAGVDVTGLLGEYESAARRAGFMAGIAVGLQLMGGN